MRLKLRFKISTIILISVIALAATLVYGHLTGPVQPTYSPRYVT
jgi:hypothetical protein